MSTIEIFLVEDDVSVGQSIQAIVRSTGRDAKVFGTAEAFLETSVPDRRVGCLITDLRLPGISGLELITKLTESGSCLGTIAITGFADTPTTVDALQSGALTVLDKPFSDAQLCDAIDNALAYSKRCLETQERLGDIRQGMKSLSHQERQILEMLMEGTPNKAMAHRLNVSTRTIENRRKRVYQKMSANSVAELVRKVTELRLHDEDDRDIAS